MTILIYAGISIALLLVILWLLAGVRSEGADEAAPGTDYAQNCGEARWLDLSERIFDPADARWLREELAFPGLAKSLTHARKQLAIRWMKALQTAFDELVRTPEIVPEGTPEANSVGSWELLWLTIRFQLLLRYALLIVKVFGPYHRLLPSFSWVQFPTRRTANLRHPAFVNTRNVN
jgi:hypothetical protein